MTLHGLVRTGLTLVISGLTVLAFAAIPPTTVQLQTIETYVPPHGLAVVIPSVEIGLYDSVSLGVGATGPISIYVLSGDVGRFFDWIISNLPPPESDFCLNDSAPGTGRCLEAYVNAFPLVVIANISVGGVTELEVAPSLSLPEPIVSVFLVSRLAEDSTHEVSASRVSRILMLQPAVPMGTALIAIGVPAILAAIRRRNEAR